MTDFSAARLMPWCLPFLHPDGSGNVVIRDGDTWVYCDPGEIRAMRYNRMLKSLQGGMFYDIEKRRCLIEAYGVPQRYHGTWMREHGSGM